VPKIRETLERAGLKAEVQTFGSSRDVLTRMPPEKGQSSAALSAKVQALLRAEDPGAEVRRVEFVGPQVGEELAEYGARALLITVVGIVAYLALRFEWKFGLAAIIANLHDVVIILGFFAAFQWDFSLPVLAAVLAILGYSVNESVVVFNRVRENFSSSNGGRPNSPARCRAHCPVIPCTRILRHLTITPITHIYAGEASPERPAH
jgi:preprotein translocase subunit SecF